MFPFYWLIVKPNYQKNCSVIFILINNSKLIVAFLDTMYSFNLYGAKVIPKSRIQSIR